MLALIMKNQVYSKWTKVFAPPRFPIIIHIKPLFCRMLVVRRLFELQRIFLYSCIKRWFVYIMTYHTATSDKKHWACKLETVKSQFAFFTLNSRRLSIDYDVTFFSTQTTLQKKLNAVTFFVWLNFTSMLWTIVTSINQSLRSVVNVYFKKTIECIHTGLNLNTQHRYITNS